MTEILSISYQISSRLLRGRIAVDFISPRCIESSLAPQLQGTLSSILSPLIVLLVYVINIGANTLLGFRYNLHEHLTIEAISKLIYVSLQAAVATTLISFVPLYTLTYGLRAVHLDPDILVVPLASAAGHFIYMALFVKIHNAPSAGEDVDVEQPA